MKLVALMLVRNEDWVLGLSARAALMWCDAICFYLHNCTDGTHDILDRLETEYSGRIFRAWNRDEGWPEMDMRQALLEQGRAAGGTHFALVDADEVLTANLIPVICDRVEALAPRHALELPMAATWRSIWRYRDDQSVWSKAWLSLAVCDHPDLTWKPNREGYQHHHRLPYGIAYRRHEGAHGTGGVMHLQFADWRRLVAKHALYQMHEAVNYPEIPHEKLFWKYTQATDEGGLRTTQVPLDWWSLYSQWLPLLRLGGIPWHEARARELWNLHGKEKFAGLNLFGVVP
jgi:hypothetical protein